MICNIQLADSQGVDIKIQPGFLTYHVDNFCTWVPICLGESHSPREERKPGWIVGFDTLCSIRTSKSLFIINNSVQKVKLWPITHTNFFCLLSNFGKIDIWNSWCPNSQHKPPTNVSLAFILHSRKVEYKERAAKARTTSTLRGLWNAAYSRTWVKTMRREPQQERTVLQQPPQHRPIQDVHYNPGLKLSSPKSVNFAFHLEIKVIWRKSGDAQNASDRTSSVMFAQSAMLWGAMWSSNVGLTVFYLVQGQHSIYQEILERLMLPSADIMEISGISEFTETNLSLIIF